MNLLKYLGLCFVVVFAACSGAGISVKIQTDLTDAPVRHAISAFAELSVKKVLQMKSSDPDWLIYAQIDTTIGAEAYQVKTSGKEIKVTGGDAVGVMYGLMYIKEQFENGKT